ncbi:glycosyltransferase family 39 protein [Candidatus Leptofilum sp.]|uniref:glycosyltransferase family 39 protein n=1 Tax=Candidatus Leptofilum sp. TaxID=3241576 RepID=UPI003B5BD9A4
MNEDNPQISQISADSLLTSLWSSVIPLRNSVFGFLFSDGKQSIFRWLNILLILLAFGLRLQNADFFSFWTDEGLTPLRAGYTIPDILSNRVVIQEGVTNDTHPPFFFLIIHFTRQLFGESDFAYRYPPLLAGVLLLPLLAQVGRRMRGVWLGLVVAGLTAVNPLQIWYASEARMYTLAVLLVTAASYVLWRTIQQTHNHTVIMKELVRPLLGYVLLAGLAFYTHYTAALLIAGQGLFWLLILWWQGYKRLLGGMLLLGLLIAAPLVPYTVPRFFSGYEANFYPVSPWIMLQDVVRFFALGRSVDFESAGVIGLNIGAFLLLLVGLWQARGGWRRPFLLIWLLAIVLGLMAGSIFKPMYQGVRHIMLGSPAFLLLLGYGLVGLAGLIRRSGGFQRLAWGAMLAIGLAVVTVGPFLALDNYFNGRFGKDDFRSLIQHIEANAGDNDVIVYNNAILLPLHAHYQQKPNLTVTASPVYPKQASSSPAQLTELAQAYDTIWLVTDPPADERDSDGVVRRWLDENLLLVESTFFDSHTVEVRSRAYSTAPFVLDDLPVDGRSHNIAWQNYPTLLSNNLRLAESAIWLDLFWQGNPPADLHGLRFTVQSPERKVWQTAESAINLEASWQPNAINRRSHIIPLPTGMPPGDFTLLAQPIWRSDIPQVLADPQTLATVSLPADLRAEADWPRPPAAASFANGVQLREIALAETAVRPGHNLPLTLFWQMENEEAVTDLRYELTVTASDGTILRQQSGRPGASWLTAWQPNQYLREPTGLYFPPETEPGTYQLELRLFEGEEAVVGRPFWWPLNQESVKIGDVEVTPWPLETELPIGTIPVDASFGPNIRLHSYQLDITPEAVDVTLYWQTSAPPTTGWFVFVHLVDETGEIVTQRDLVPADGLRPTTGWRTDEIITDAHDLTLPPNLPPGNYIIRVGLFEPESFARPAVAQNGQPLPDNQLILTEISLP